MAKQQQKNNTGIIIGVVACIAVVAIIVGVIIAKNNSGGNGGDNGGDNGGTSNVDYSTVDETVTYGDYESMETLSKAIQNGEMLGKKVKIDGIVMHPMSTYSVGQANSDGSKKIGTEFVIEGAEDADYPQDGDRVVITGEVIQKSPMYFVIQTTPKYVEVK